MKKQIVLLFLFASFFFIACNKELDYTSDGRILINQVFKDRYKTMGYLNACYGYCPAPNLNRSYDGDEAESSSDNISGTQANIWYAGSVTASTYASYSIDGSPWGSLYDGIRYCNVFLANIGTATADMSDDERQGWAAQAHTLRALYYLQLIKRYGGVPIVYKALSADHDYSKDSRATFSQVVAFIFKDCDSALSAPETQEGFPWGIYTNQFGIMSRAIPYAIKSEAVTYAASPLWSDGTYTWADAKTINKEALYQCLTHDYSLFNQAPVANAAQNAYALYFITSSNDQRSVDKETIYQCGTQLSVWQNAGLSSNSGVSSAGPSPTQELVDCYEMAQGTLPILGYNDNAHLSPIINPASGYDPQNPYVNRDPRFYASIYYNGAVRYLNQPNGQKVQSYVGGADGISQTNTLHTRTGYYIRKFNNWQSALNNNADGAIRLFRLAELYLNFAESAYQSDGPDVQIQLGSGMAMSARDAIDAVRERAGMPDLPSGMDKTTFQTRYRNERRVEFAFEGHRFFDVRRWKILSQTDQLVTGMQITQNGSSLSYARFGFNARNCSADKWLMYPVDQSEVAKMEDLTGNDWQNSGW